MAATPLAVEIFSPYRSGDGFNGGLVGSINGFGTILWSGYVAVMELFFSFVSNTLRAINDAQFYDRDC